MKFNYKLTSTLLFFFITQLVVAQQVSPEAIVRINSTYSGAVISEDGMVLTHSSLIRDRMGLLPEGVKPGFVAQTKEEEIEIRGFEIKFNEQLEDITDIILWMPTDTFTQARIDHEIQKNIFQYARLKEVKPKDIIHLPSTNTYLLNPTRSFVKIKLVEWPSTANWVKLRIYDNNNNVVGTPDYFKTTATFNHGSQLGQLYTGGYPYNSQLWLPQPIREALIKDFLPFKTEIRQQFLMAWSIGTLRAPDLKMFLDRLTDEYANWEEEYTYYLENEAESKLQKEHNQLLGDTLNKSYKEAFIASEDIIADYIQLKKTAWLIEELKKQVQLFRIFPVLDRMKDKEQFFDKNLERFYEGYVPRMDQYLLKMVMENYIKFFPSERIPKAMTDMYLQANKDVDKWMSMSIESSTFANPDKLLSLSLSERQKALDEDYIYLFWKQLEDVEVDFDEKLKTLIKNYQKTNQSSFQESAGQLQYIQGKKLELEGLCSFPAVEGMTGSPVWNEKGELIGLLDFPPFTTKEGLLYYKEGNYQLGLIPIE